MISIIIPCRNEEKYIGTLLSCIEKQTYKDYEIIIADNNSTDNTINIINQYKSRLPINVVKGGLPAVARNNGVRQSRFDLLLFIDSDIYFKDNQLIEKSVELLINKKLELVTCYINSDKIKTKIIYFLSNVAMMLSKLEKPFATTQFFLIKKETFNKFNGFNEDVKHCEDYLLSKNINKKKFGIVKYFSYSDDRRFKKTGYFKFFVYFIKNMINRNDVEYFKKEINYWV